MWKIEESPSHLLVTMTSNGVNKIDGKFLSDLHSTFEVLEKSRGAKPLVLNSEATAAFSVGLDFHYCFSIFERQDEKEIADWFDYFRSALMRVYRYPGKTIAAIDGHTFAGGLILALACDYRIAVDRKYKFALNEVPIGIPMPAVYCEIIRQKVGNAAAFDTILTGRVFDVKEAFRLGFVHELVSTRENLIAAAKRSARQLPMNAWAVYAHTKKLLLSKSLEYIQTKAMDLDLESIAVIASKEANLAQQAALARLRRSKRLWAG